MPINLTKNGELQTKGSASIWVGPTECDANRESRTKTVNEIWAEIARNRNLALAHLTLGGALDLFRESLSAFQNGGFMASTLMCRSATETAIYLSISRKTPSPPPSTIEVDIQHIRAKWDKVRGSSVEKGLLTEDDLAKLAEIRERGNFVAHYGQKFDQRIYSPVDSKLGELRLWVNAYEAEDSLRKTATILNNIIDRLLT